MTKIVLKNLRTRGRFPVAVNGRLVFVDPRNVPNDPAILGALESAGIPFSNAAGTIPTGRHIINGTGRVPLAINGTLEYVERGVPLKLTPEQRALLEAIGADFAPEFGAEEYVDFLAAFDFRRMIYRSGRKYTTGGPRVNHLLHGNDYTQAAWTLQDTTVGAKDSNGLALLTEGTAGSAGVFQVITAPAAQVVYSVDLKRGNHDWAALVIRDAGNTNTIVARLNIATGAIGAINQSAGGVFASPIATVTPLGAGVFRCSLAVRTTNGTATLRAETISHSDGTTAGARVANGTRYQGKSQLEDGTTATAYIPSGAKVGLADGIADLPGFSFARTGVVKQEIEAYVNGPELVTNGGFGTDTAWTKESGWTISGGKAVYAPGAVNAALHQAVSSVALKTYRVKFDLTLNAGVMSVKLGHLSNSSPAYNSSGSKTVDLVVASGSNNVLYFTAGTDFNGSIDNISVFQVDANLANGSYLGDELVTNGRFDTDIAGWSDSNNAATLTWEDGRIRVARRNTTAFPNARTALTGLIVGRTYQITSEVSNPNGLEAYQSLAGISSSVDRSFSTSDTLSSTFVASATSHNLDIGLWNTTGTVGQYVDFDNISVREVIPEAFDTFAPNVPGIVPGVGYWSRAGLTNLVLQSQAFDTASWTKANTTVSANAALAPDGTLTADRLVEAATTSEHDLYQAVTATAGALYTAFIYMKAGERIYGGLQLHGSGSVYYAVVVNLTNGQVTATSTAGATSTSHKVTDVGNGWYKIEVSAVLGTLTTIYALPFLSDVAVPAFNLGRVSYLGDTTKGAFIWQAQLVAGSDPGPVIPTTTAAASTGADVLSLATPITAEEDFVMWAVADFKDTPAAAQRVLSINDGTGSNRILLERRVTDGALYAFHTAAGTTTNSYSPKAQANAGRAVLLLRRSSGNWTMASKISDGTSGIGTSVAGGFPIGLSRLDVGSFVGSNQINAPIEFVGIRKGTFTDAEITAILEAA